MPNPYEQFVSGNTAVVEAGNNKPANPYSRFVAQSAKTNPYARFVRPVAAPELPSLADEIKAGRLRIEPPPDNVVRTKEGFIVPSPEFLQKATGERPSPPSTSVLDWEQLPEESQRALARVRVSLPPAEPSVAAGPLIETIKPESVRARLNKNFFTMDVETGTRKFLLPSLYEQLPAPVKGTFSDYDEFLRETAAKDPSDKFIQKLVGIEEGLGTVAKGLLQPVNLALIAGTAGFGELPVATQKVIQLAFATQMASATPELAKQMGDAWGRGDLREVYSTGTQGLVNTGLAGWMGAHGLSPTRGLSLEAQFERMTPKQQKAFLTTQLSRTLQGKAIPELTPEPIQPDTRTGAEFWSQTIGDLKEQLTKNQITKGGQNAIDTRTQPVGNQPEYPGTAQRVAIPKNAPEVRGAEGEPTGGGGGVEPGAPVQIGSQVPPSSGKGEGGRAAPGATVSEETGVLPLEGTKGAKTTTSPHPSPPGVERETTTEPALVAMGADLHVEPELRRHQVFGVRGAGSEYTPEKIDAVRQAVRAYLWDGTQPVTPERTEQAWKLVTDLIKPETQLATAQGIRNKFGSDMAVSMALNDAWEYSVKLMGQGDASLAKFIIENHNDFARNAGVETATTAGRTLRAIREASGDAVHDLLGGMLDSRDVSAVKTLGKDGEQVVEDLKRGLKGVRITPDDLEATTTSPRPSPPQAAEREKIRKAWKGSAAAQRELLDAIQSQPFRMQDAAWRQQVAERWFQSKGLSGEGAREAAVLFSDEFGIALNKARAKVAEQVLSGKRGITDLADVLKVVRAGGDVLDKLAEKQGWKPITPEQFKRIADIDVRLSDPAIDPSTFVKLHEEMVDVLRLNHPAPAFMRRILEGMMSSMLSGIRTLDLHVFQQPLVMSFDLVTRALMHPMEFPALAGTLIDGIKSSWPEFKFAWQNDAFKSQQRQHIYWAQALKYGWQRGLQQIKSPDLLTQARGAANLIYSSQQFVMRTLGAVMNANWVTDRQYFTAIYASRAARDLGLKDVLPQLVRAQREWKQTAFNDGIERGLDRNYAAARANDLVNDKTRDFLQNKLGFQKAAEVLKAAENDAYSSVGRSAPGLRQTDEGMATQWMNQLIQGISRSRSEPGAEGVGIFNLLAFGFVKIPWNVMRFMSRWSPYEFVRYGVNKARVESGRDSYWKQSYATDLQARENFQRAVVGTTLMTALFAYNWHHSTADVNAGQEKAAFYFTGRGPVNRVLNDQWQKAGWKPNSLMMIVDGHKVAVPMTRIGAIFGMVFGAGAVHDDLAWERREAANKPLSPTEEAAGKTVKSPRLTVEVGGAIATYMSLLGQQGIFQSLKYKLESLPGVDPQRSTGLSYARLAAESIAPAVTPFNQFQNSVMSMIRGVVDRSSIESATAAAFPILGAYWQKQALNRYGDPLYDQTWYGKVGQMGSPIAFKVKEDKDNRLFYNFLVTKGVAAPLMYRTSIEDKYGYLTDTEWSNFVKESGGFIKNSVLAELKKPNTAIHNWSSAQVKDYLGSLATTGRQDAMAARSLKNTVLPFFGYPAETAQPGLMTPAEAKAAEISRQLAPLLPRTPEEKQHSELMQKLVHDLRTGQFNDKGQLVARLHAVAKDKAEEKTIAERALWDPFNYQISKMPFDQAMEVWDVANDGERMRVAELMHDKLTPVVRTAAKSEKIGLNVNWEELMKFYNAVNPYYIRAKQQRQGGAANGQMKAFAQ